MTKSFNQAFSYLITQGMTTIKECIENCFGFTMDKKKTCKNSQLLNGVVLLTWHFILRIDEIWSFIAYYYVSRGMLPLSRSASKGGAVGSRWGHNNIWWKLSLVALALSYRRANHYLHKSFNFSGKRDNWGIWNSVVFLDFSSCECIFFFFLYHFNGLRSVRKGKGCFLVSSFPFPGE